MALAPVVAASLNVGLPTIPKALYIDGLNVLKQTAAGFGTPIETIELREAGAGQVSSMTFRIDDPTGSFSVAVGQTIRFADLTRNLPLFLGWVDSYKVEYLGVGRSITVTCMGVEAILDWRYVGTYVIAASSNWPDVIFGLAGVAEGSTSPLLLNAGSGDPTRGLETGVGVGVLSAMTVSGTLRSCIEQVAANYASGLASLGFTLNPFEVTVDFWGRLLVYTVVAGLKNIGTGLSQNNARLDIAVGTSRAPANHEYRVSGSEATRNVYIQGSGSVRGVVSDGTGIAGSLAVISDSTVTSADQFAGIAAGYFSSHGVGTGGSVELQETANVGAVGAEFRVGGNCRVTDAGLGVNALDARIRSISKTFNPSGTEIWELDYGSDFLTASTYLRRLTRAVII